MDLFSSFDSAFLRGEELELKTGYDIENTFSRVRVVDVSAGSCAVVPWLIKDAKEVSQQRVWLSIATLFDLYKKRCDQS